jgi:hypothetical protein
MENQRKVEILLSSSPERLGEALARFETFGVVEAEFGGIEVTGSLDEVTLNHHIRPERGCPCLAGNAERVEVEAIGISHFDLDTLGGVLALLGLKPEAPTFWAMAAWVDTKGPHRVREYPEGYSEEVHTQLAAFWAWSQGNRLFPPRDGSVEEVTSFLDKARMELGAILDGLREDQGRAFLAAEEDLKRDSFRKERVTPEGLRVILREGEGFVNHLYYMRDGSPGDVVIGLNTKFSSVTVSCSGGQMSCKDFVQALWGPEAGGHAGIAGSPRGRVMTLEDAEEAFRLDLK